MLKIFVGEVNSSKSTTTRDESQHAKQKFRPRVGDQTLRENTADNNNGFFVVVCNLVLRPVASEDSKKQPRTSTYISAAWNREIILDLEGCDRRALAGTISSLRP